jgi:hypothetical protein
MPNVLELSAFKSVAQTHPVPKKAGNLVSLVDRCYVCDRKFIAYGGNDSALIQEFHHIFPQAFGGTKGPTVSLCSGHHSSLHRIAERVLAGKSYNEFLQSGENHAIINQRLFYLANCVVQATRKLKEDPNRMVPVQVNGNANFHSKLAKISEYYKKSKADTIKCLIEAEHRRLFP